MNESIGLALLMTTLAGLSTTVGAALGVLGRPPRRRMLALSMGFSAGVMVMLAFGAMLGEAQEIIGRGWGLFVFIAGAVGMWVLETVIPHEYLLDRYGNSNGRQVFRAGLLAAIGIAIHNFPEGIAVFFSGVHDIRLGWTLAGGIALHNIPEGLAVSVPVYTATGSRAKAFWWATFSGLAEPVGATLAAIALRGFLSSATVACALAAAGGIMFFIALFELLPAAQSEGEGHAAVAGVLAGTALIALGLWAVG